MEKKIDIGFPQLSFGSKSEIRKERMSYVKSQRQSVDLEKQARNQTRNLAVHILLSLINRIIVSAYTVLVNLDEVKTDWSTSNGQYHIRDVANHYGVFEHLYGKYAYFSPRIPLSIKVNH